MLNWLKPGHRPKWLRAIRRGVLRTPYVIGSVVDFVLGLVIIAVGPLVWLVGWIFKGDDWKLYPTIKSTYDPTVLRETAWVEGTHPTSLPRD